MYRCSDGETSNAPPNKDSIFAHQCIEREGFCALSLALPISFLLWWAALAIGPLYGGDLGQAHLGTQGDVWDAQKDSALAAMGTLSPDPVASAQRVRHDRFRFHHGHVAGSWLSGSSGCDRGPSQN